ncbi:hypothetical protein LTS18_009796, partial [Coniosporium uncinatum]
MLIRACCHRDPAMTEKITKSLNLTIPPHILRSRDPRALLTALFAAWLPLSTALLVSVIEHLPSPPTAQAARIPDIIKSSPGSEHIDANVSSAMTHFKSSSADPVVAYVSKMVAIPESELPENKRRGGGNLTAEEARDLARKKRAELARAQQATNGGADGGVQDLASAVSSAAIGEDEAADGGGKEEDERKEDPEHLIGFARLYSGTLTVGDEVYVLPPKFSPANAHAVPEPQKVMVTALYLLMGRSLEPLTSVPAGVVFGVAGLEGHILKSGTLCSQLEGGVNLAGVNLGSQPIVRVALEPVNPSELHKMVRGLKMLVQSDPCAEYEVLESGEHVILTAGELHLERCLKDLRERFAKCEIQAGEPIVPYRESIVRAEEMSPPKDPNLPRGTVVGVTSSKQVSVRLRVRPLPAAVTEFLSKNAGAIKRLYAEKRAEEEGRRATDTPEDVPEDQTQDTEGLEDIGVVETGNLLNLADFKKQLKEAFAEAKAEKDVWAGTIEKIAAFGPRRTGPNVLIDNCAKEVCYRVLRDSDTQPMGDATDTKADEIAPRDFSDKIVYAFQLATAQGPLCNEPVQGVAVFLEDVKIDVHSTSEEPSNPRDNLGRLTGEVI